MIRNAALHGLVDQLSVWVSNNLQKDITLTHLYRTAEEQVALYAATEPAKRPTASPHQVWNAVDLRSSVYTPEEVAGIVAWVNKHYTNPNGRVCALAHAIAGGAYHLHIQYPLK